jgi:hypothetical protein
MGRPLLTAPFTAIIPSSEALKDSSAEVVGKDAGPRRWCEKDTDPDEEAWWSGRVIFIESFIQTKATKAENVVSPRDGNQERSTIAPKESASASKLMPKVSPLEKHPVAEPSRQPIELLFPQRFTISEQQLASTQLDTISSDLEEDFELDWETGSDSDMDVYTNTSTPDSQSEVSSSPPTRSMLRSMTTVPIAVPRTPEYTRSRTLPISGTPMATSVCQSGFHMSPPAITSLTSGSPISARSIPRVRGFAVHSPRTELVL